MPQALTERGKGRRTFEAQMKPKPLFEPARRSEAVPYIHSFGGLCACRGRCLSSPRLIQTNVCIGAFLPLPSGEVVARSADGEGEGAAHLRGADENETVV